MEVKWSKDYLICIMTTPTLKRHQFCIKSVRNMHDILSTGYIVVFSSLYESNCFKKKIKVLLHLYRCSVLTWHMCFKPTMNKGLRILQNQYHGALCLGDFTLRSCKKNVGVIMFACNNRYFTIQYPELNGYGIRLVTYPSQYQTWNSLQLTSKHKKLTRTN